MAPVRGVRRGGRIGPGFPRRRRPAHDRSLPPVRPGAISFLAQSGNLALVNEVTARSTEGFAVGVDPGNETDVASHGCQGFPDGDPAARAAPAVADRVLRHPEPEEVEANPVFVYPDRAVAVDVRAFLGKEGEGAGGRGGNVRTPKEVRMGRIGRVLGAALVALAAGSGAWAQEPSREPYDVLIRNGRVLDGTGNPWYRADVAVRGDRIAAVGDLTGVRARRVVDATGLFVAPGFIDVHSHAGPGLEKAELSEARPLLAQGVTTVVVNPDGGGPVDLAAQRTRLLEHGLGVNVALLVPHGSVRRQVLGMEDRAPTPAELEEMKRLVRAGMEEGAYGLSSGLYYAPGSYAGTEEVIELARVAAEYGGVYTSHIRDEADYNVGVVAAVEEVIRIAREAGLPGIVTHIKALGPRVWGFSAALVHRIERARAEGVEVYADQYPYEASGTSITGALVPRWALVGGRDELLRRIEDPAERARLRADMLENLDRRGGAGRLQFQRHAADPSVEGRTLQEVAEERGVEPVDLAIELLKEGGAGLVSFNMIAEDVERLMRRPWTMTCSDGGLVPMGRGVPHPRFYGTFPRKIRKYVVEEEVLPLSQAIRSMTSLSAGVFGMRDRGRIEPGAAADLVVFDLSRFRDLATYEDPHRLSEGAVHVLVNGVFAVDGGRFTGALAGRVLPGPERVARSGGG